MAHSHNRMSMWRKWLFSTLLFLAFFEIGLRVTGLYSTYSEKIGSGYATYYGQTDNDHYHTWMPNQDIVYDQPEFKFSFKANSFGIRENEISEQKPDSVFRIICIGDSFTEGDGADHAHSYPRALERKLNGTARPGLSYQIYNAGVSGSDLFFMNSLLRDKLASYHPDAVIYLINGSDITDVIFRGGSERFLLDGTSRFRQAPWFHPFYRFSYVVRFITETLFGVSEHTLIPKNNIAPENNKAINMLASEMTESRNLCNSINADCRIIVHPSPTKHTHKLATQVNELLNNGHPRTEVDSIIADELPDLSKLMEAGGIENTLTDFILQWGQMEPQEYYWPINGHYNAKGYEILADHVYDQVVASDPDFFLP